MFAKARYVIDAKKFNFHSEKERTIDKLSFDSRYEYYVDILETSETDLVKMKIYMPDGSIHIGWQFNWFLRVKYLGNPFDGRYNS